MMCYFIPCMYIAYMSMHYVRHVHVYIYTKWNIYILHLMFYTNQ